MKLLRILRLDASDEHAFERAARPGEWAVPGSFAFLDSTPESLDGKRLQAFRNGFLGTESFGWGTLVEIAEITPDDYQQVVDRLAAHLIAEHGAPHIAAALPVAGDEVDYAASLCEEHRHASLSLERSFDEKGRIVEQFRLVRPSAAGSHEDLRLWGPAEGDDESP